MKSSMATDPTPLSTATKVTAFGPENPFYAASSLPFQAPAFDVIRDEHYQPAIEAGMSQQTVEVQAIAAAADAPTFENTIVALERSGQLFHRAMAAFSAVAGANTNDVLQQARATLAPRLAAHSDSIYLNEDLFRRVDAIYDQRAALQLDAESARLLEVTYDEFVRAGAKLAEAEKIALRALNEEASTLSNGFLSRTLQAAKEAAFVTTKEPTGALAGLSEAQLSAAALAAAGRGVDGYVLPMQNTTQQPVLAFLQDRATRQSIFEMSLHRTERGDENDTRALVARLAQVRAERARLLGYTTYAAWKLEDQMAKTPATVTKFLASLVPEAKVKALRERDDIQAVIDTQAENFSLRPWDWAFYAEQVRKARYDLNEADVKPYFELERVLQNGVFYAATQLYGLTFQERCDLPVYHPDVRVFEVFDTDGRSMALFYCDFFKRDNKNGGAWMSSLVTQSRLLGSLPVVTNVCNVTKPAQGEPALLSFSDVTTLFHEFGHALHGIFAEAMYPSLSGTATPRDFVEFPSQFNERWAVWPSIFRNYACHYETSEPMPEDLAEKLRSSATFNDGYELVELLAAATLDMRWHTLSPEAPVQEAEAFETAALQEAGLLLDCIPPRYRSTYFSHIWGGGYAAGYYAYLWTRKLDEDAFEWFEEHGGLTRANGDRFRRMVLCRGNTQDLPEMYDAWRGRPAAGEAGPAATAR